MRQGAISLRRAMQPGPGEVPAQVRKAIEDGKAGGKREHKLLEEIAILTADAILATLGDASIARRFYPDRELAFIKLLAQRLTRQGKVVALIGCGGSQPAVVFAQSAGLPNDMGALMKEALVELGGRGGGNKDMAQGGAQDASKIEAVLEAVSGKIAYPFMGAYAASKHALEAMSDSWRRELMIYGVDVIVIEPGSIDTPIWDKANHIGTSFRDTDYAPLFEYVNLADNRRTAQPVARVSLRISTVKLRSVQPPRLRIALFESVFNFMLPSDVTPQSADLSVCPLV